MTPLSANSIGQACEEELHSRVNTVPSTTVPKQAIRGTCPTSALDPFTLPSASSTNVVLLKTPPCNPKKMGEQRGAPCYNRCFDRSLLLKFGSCRLWSFKSKHSRVEHQSAISGVFCSLWTHRTHSHNLLHRHTVFCRSTFVCTFITHMFCLNFRCCRVLVMLAFEEVDCGHEAASYKCLCSNCVKQTRTTQNQSKAMLSGNLKNDKVTFVLIDLTMLQLWAVYVQSLKRIYQTNKWNLSNKKTTRRRI